MRIESRRNFVKKIAVGSILTAFPAAAKSFPVESFPTKRPPIAQRKFTSLSVEQAITHVRRQISDPELAWMFENCFPNTLDTTVRLGVVDGKPDAFLVTGDIDAMWLRDSSCQVWPYLRLAKEDDALQRLFRGLIGRQARSV